MKVTQGKILKALHGGAVIRVDHISSPDHKAGVIYRLSTNNRAVPRDLVKRMLADELIKGGNDAFDFGEPQTYTIRRPSEGPSGPGAAPNV